MSEITEVLGLNYDLVDDPDRDLKQDENWQKLDVSGPLCILDSILSIAIIILLHYVFYCPKAFFNVKPIVLIAFILITTYDLLPSLTRIVIFYIELCHSLI